MLMTHSFGSDALTQGNIEDLQDSGPSGLDFPTPVLDRAKLTYEAYVEIFGVVEIV